MTGPVTIGLAVAASAVVLAAVYADVTAPMPELRAAPGRTTPLAVARPMQRSSVRRANLVVARSRPATLGRSATNPTAAPLVESAVLAPVVDQDPGHSGVCVVDDRVTIVSYDAWINFSSRAIAEALIDGARGADGVLIHVMRRALPQYRWPPAATSAMAKQWPEMIRVVAEHLYVAPEPEPQRTTKRLRLI